MNKLGTLHVDRLPPNRVEVRGEKGVVSATFRTHPEGWSGYEIEITWQCDGDTESMTWERTKEEMWGTVMEFAYRLGS